jgi:competence protein ComEC
MQEQVQWLKQRLIHAWLKQRSEIFNWVPVFLAFGIAFYFSLPNEPDWRYWAFVLTVEGIGLAIARWGAEDATPLGWAMMLFAMGFALAVARAHLVAAPVLDEPYFGPVQGRIVGIDRSANDAVRLLLAEPKLSGIEPEETPRRVRVALHGEAAEFTPEAGQIVVLEARLSPTAGPTEPGGFDFQRQSWFAGLGAVGYARTPVLIWEEAQGGGVFALRLWLAQEIQAHLPGQIGAIAAAIAAGERSGLSQETLEALRVSNLAHLLAISGLHMGMLAGFVYAAVQLCIAMVPFLALRWRSHKIAAFFALAAAAFYLVLSGRNVATERAFIMAAVMLCAILLDKRALSLRSVAFAAIIVLVIRPESLLSPGFQMSFAATAALVGVFGAIRDHEWPQKLGVFRPAMTLALSSLVAGLATGPIAAAHFNQVSHFGFLANLLAVPAMGLIVMPAAVITAICLPLGLEGWPLAFMRVGLEWILVVAREVSALPNAKGVVASPPLLVLALYAAGGCLLVLWKGRLRLLGVLPILVAGFIWATVQRPMILVADNGALVGVMTPSGRALSRERSAGFAAESWLENDGDFHSQKEAASLWPPDGALVLPSGVSIRNVTGKKRVAEMTCSENEFLIVNAEPPKGLPCQIIGPKEFEVLGALAIEAGGKLRSTSGPEQKRLWHMKKEPRAEALFQIDIRALVSAD